MDEKHAYEQSQPLLDQGPKHVDDLEALDPPENPRPKRPIWKRIIRIALTLLVLHLSFRTVRRSRYTRHWFQGKHPEHHEDDFELPPSEFDEWVPGFNSLAEHGGKHGPHFAYNKAIQEMDADLVLDPNDTSDPLHFSLSTKPEKIGIFSRGPIVGNVTFDSKAKGDKVEVTIELFNITHHPDGFHPFGKPGCKKGWKGPKRAWPFPPRHPHPPPVPTVKIREFVNDDGEVQGLGLFAYVEHHHKGPGGPPPPPPGAPDHPPPPPPGAPDHPPPHHPHGHPPPPPPPHGHPRDPEDGNELPSFRRVSDQRGPCKKGGIESRYQRWSLFGSGSPDPKKPKHGHGWPGRRRRGHGPLVGAKIHVSFPASTDITFFGSELRLFKHSVGALKPTFGNFTISTAHGGVSIDSLTTGIGHIASGHGGISGTFDVYKALELKTTHSPIDVDVTLHNSPHDDSRDVTVLGLSNVHGSTNATVSLVSDESDSDLKSLYPPTYLVKSKSIHNDTSISFTSQPVDSTLFFGGDGVGSSITAAFAPAFDGTYKINTVFSPPLELVVDESVEDPAGEGRKRVVTREDKFAESTGSIHWVDESLDDDDEPKVYPGFIGVHGVKTKVTLKF